jgi:hypothetical protein
LKKNPTKIAWIGLANPTITRKDRFQTKLIKVRDEMLAVGGTVAVLY